MVSPLITLILAFYLQFGTAEAQYYSNRRRRPVSGIVAGVVVGCFCLFLLLFLCLCARRIRSRRAYQARISGGPPPKPLFGGPWGRQDAAWKQPTAPMAQSGPQGVNRPGVDQAGYNVNEPAPPPYNGPDAAKNNNVSYAPPLEPPPQAHTAGQDNTFVGGFRQGNPV